jgi:hypothetical protein
MKLHCFTEPFPCVLKNYLQRNAVPMRSCNILTMFPRVSRRNEHLTVHLCPEYNLLLIFHSPDVADLNKKRFSNDLTLSDEFATNFVYFFV